LIKKRGENNNVKITTYILVPVQSSTTLQYPTLCIGLGTGLFPSSFPKQNFVFFSLVPRTRYVL